MLKFLLIVGLVAYILYKIGSFFFRAGAASQQFRNQQRSNFNTHNGPAASEKRKGPDLKGGEYIDYEEVK